jgi:stage II sporulation protein D
MFAIRKISLSFVILLIVSATIFAQDPIEEFMTQFNGEIPVELFAGQNLYLGVRGGEATLECYRGNRLSEMYYFSSDIKLYYRENGIEIDDDDGALSIGLTEVQCKPRSDSSMVSFNGHAFRGYFRVIYLDLPAGINLINVVNLEDYVKGVLPGEIGDRTPQELESVKAQALAARTYAVWKLTDQGTSGKLGPTIADQLYTGADGEKELLSRAVDITSGQIMTYKGRPIAAYYHAVCGGRTAPIQDIWPEKHSRPYLVGVNDDDNCSWAKSYSWTEDFTYSQLQDALDKYFTEKGLCREGAFGQVRDIGFTLDKNINRIKTMKVTTNTGAFKVTNDQIRWALGRPSVPGAILPSTMFNAVKRMNGPRLVGLKITGTGNGHGVGMCQCGAIAQSRVGKKYDDILKFYYKRIKIEKIY